MHANDHPLPEPESWWDRAACAGYGHDMFFPTTTDKIAAALAVCARCPVQVDCLTAALQEEADADRSRPYGIRGGTTAADRDRIAKHRKRTAPR